MHRVKKGLYLQRGYRTWVQSANTGLMSSRRKQDFNPKCGDRTCAQGPETGPLHRVETGLMRMEQMT